ncbi:MAG: SGNH/GDSL hydrolase family protein [Lysobacterales bacterium]
MLAGDPEPPLRYLALGDSYSIGESVEAAARWPNQLVQRLRAHHPGLRPAEIFARTGWTTDELSAALNAAEGGTHVELAADESGQGPKPPYHLVTLLIGVNDQYRGHPIASYRQGFAALLARAIDYAGGHAERVLVLSIPDWGRTPFAQAQQRDAARISQEIDAYNAAALELTRKAGASFVDITHLTREAETRPELLAADGLHPSAIDYDRWAERALPAAARALGGVQADH